MKKILVIDADAEMLNTLKTILTRHGFDVFVKTECSQLAEVLNEYRPNLILLGMQSPTLQDFLCEEVVKKSAIPVIEFSPSRQPKEAAALKETAVNLSFELPAFLNNIKIHLN